MNAIKVSIFLLFLLKSVDLFAASAVIKHPDPSQPLATRWTWAVNKGGEFKQGYWIGYSIQRLMNVDETIGHFDDRHSSSTLMEILTGQKPERQEKTIREEAQRILNKSEAAKGAKKWKDLAVLVQIQPPAKTVTRINVSNLELSFPLKNLPILWLGSSDNEPSIQLLQTLYKNTAAHRRREEVIAAIAMHQSPDLVLPFLRGVVTNEKEEELRKNAIFWLGQTQEPGALKFLTGLIRPDTPPGLIKSSVFSISQMHLPEANQALVDLAKQTAHREARLEAIFWISQQRSDQTPKILEQIVFQDEDEEVKRKSVFAISQLKKESGSPMLVRIATKHPQTRVREEAVFWIGQSGGKTEGDLLEKIAHQDPDRSVQKKAIFSLSQMDKEISISGLERIAKTHSDTELRKEAIFWLGQMNDRRAKNVLLQFIKK
jgi:HEAT repeat protein